MAPGREAGANGAGPGRWRDTAAGVAALLAPILLLVGIALLGSGDGGYDVQARHIAGLCVWLVVVGLLVFGAAGRTRVAGPLYLAIGLLFALAALSAASSAWSGSTERSVTEADRILVYLGVLIAAFLLTQTRERRQRFAEGLAIALATIAVLGTLSRLLPDVLGVHQPPQWGARLTYPLGYWNANGTMFAMGVAMLLWASRRATWTALRYLAAACIPVAMLGIYFTYSRGGVLALVVGSVALLALSRDRLWIAATLVLSLVATVPVVNAVQARPALENTLINTSLATRQGHELLPILAASVAIVLAGFAFLRWLERREGRATLAVVHLSRNQTLLGGIAVFAIAFAAVAGLTLGPKAWKEFSKNDIQTPNQPSKHFTDLQGSGRRDYWRVAYHDYLDRPLLGQGAGSYEFTWEQRRSLDNPVHDAHSLYLEMFAELGSVGGLLLLALIGSLGVIGLMAWRSSAGAERERLAVLWALIAAFAVAAAFDWFWELAGLGSVFFLAAGALLSSRCEQMAASDRELGIPDDGPRYGLIAVGLLLAWVSAAALIAPLLVDRELSSSRKAAAEGNIAKAVDDAENARAIEPWAASPYLQLGLLAELAGDYDTAAARLTDAIEREDRNWQLYFLRARTEREAGNAAAARADLAKVRELNPLGPVQPESGGG